VGSFLGGPSAPFYAPYPTREDPYVVAARERARIAALEAKGRKSTILTSGEGVEGDAPVKRRVLGAGI